MSINIGRDAQMGFLSCRAQSRHLLLLLIVKMRDSSTSLGMTKPGDPSVNRCRRFRQHAHIDATPPASPCQPFSQDIEFGPPNFCLNIKTYQLNRSRKSRGFGMVERNKLG